MTAYIQSLPEPASAAAPPAACPLHVRLRDYMAALPEHGRYENLSITAKTGHCFVLP